MILVNKRKRDGLNANPPREKRQTHSYEDETISYEDSYEDETPSSEDDTSSIKDEISSLEDEMSVFKEDMSEFKNEMSSHNIFEDEMTSSDEDEILYEFPKDLLSFAA